MRIALLDEALPLNKLFDYLPPSNIDIAQLQIGMRVHVPFGVMKRYGMITEITNETDIAPDKLKAVLHLVDSQPFFSEDYFKLLQWTARYYHYPLGGVIATALPNLLNQGVSTKIDEAHFWKLTQAGYAIDVHNQPKSKLSEPQKKLMQLLKNYPNGISKSTILRQYPTSANTLRSLEKKGWVIAEEDSFYGKTRSHLTLNTAQEKVINTVNDNLHHFYPCLLDGVTGSGKTEVYLRIIENVLNQNKQALVLVPEINLTPQTLQRFQARFDVPIATMHSHIDGKERLTHWLKARDGEMAIIIGTRSAIWTPLAHAGIFIVDEEHDHSYKQQNNLRYSARDIAVMRAQRANVPVILGTATPSLDSLYNAQMQRYHYFSLPERAGSAVHPTFHIVDMRTQPPRTRLSQQLRQAIQLRLEKKQQVLLFLNRRGYAPTMLCYQCGWTATCQHCDANMTYHDSSKELRCHHCGTVQPVFLHCPECQSHELHFIGQGTERIEEQLHQYFPNANIARIDSDSTRKKYAMDNLLTQIHNGELDILIGTQMLAKGHHFPKVTLVGVINIDGGLYSADFRGSERVAQLLMQVSGRAGRADHAGEVIVQTYNPDHPLLVHLIRENYASFAKAALLERQNTEFPPFNRLALFRAESEKAQVAKQFLEKVKTHLMTFNKNQLVMILGPVAAPMEKKASKFRMQLLLQSTRRDVLHQLLSKALPDLPTIAKTKVSWSLDIDPQDLL